MPLVSEYQNLADFVVGFAVRDQPMPPRTAARLADNLLKLADRAKRMERMAIVHDPAVYAGCEKDGDGE